MPAAGSTSKSDKTREQVVAAAVSCFARKGFYGTTTHEVAARAGISQPYVYRLFPSKPALFAAAVDHVGRLLSDALLRAGRRPVAPSALRAAYAALITDPDVLRFMMHANCATDEPVIGEAVRACYARQVSIALDLLDGDAAAVRDWFGAGMLDNVVVTLGLADSDAEWAATLAGTDVRPPL